MKYELVIVTDNGTFRAIVDKEVGEAFITEWKEWSANVAREENLLLEVHGICDSADRAERIVTVRASNVIGTDLYKLFGA